MEEWRGMADRGEKEAREGRGRTVALTADLTAETGTLT